MANSDALMNKLFKWTTTANYGDLTFYIRIVGDAVLSDARNRALLEARKLRRALRDQSGDEYLIYLDPLEDLDNEELVNTIISVAMMDVMREYMQRTPRPILSSLGNHPTQEEQEEYEAAKEDRENNYLEDMTAHVEAWRTAFKSGLEQRDRDYLLVVSRKYITDQVCEQRFSDVLEQYVLANAVYTDDKYKTRMFILEQYRDLPIDVKNLIKQAYNGINIDPDSLKN